MAISDQLDRLSNVLDKLTGSGPSKSSLDIETRLRALCDQLERVNLAPRDSLTIGNTTITEADLKKIKDLIDE